MKGWKTKAGAVLIVLSGIVEALKVSGLVDPELAGGIATLLIYIGGALGVVGLAHKIEKGSVANMGASVVSDPGAHDPLVPVSEKVL